jgi:protein-S-isoprenylcysteine O-methyltransferase Ste14
MTKFLFLIPLIAGFASNLSSAFTFYYSNRWGARAGTFITIILRDVLGIPVWVAGFVLALKEPSGMLYKPVMILNICALILITVGCLIIISALVRLRVKAAAPATSDKLTRNGIYSIIRHPIHVGTGLQFAGLFIIWPSVNVTISVILGFIWLILQSKFEEKDLVKRIPDYKEYMKEVPGFFPKTHHNNT